MQTNDEKDVAADAWLEGRLDVVASMGLGNALGYVSIATHLHQRGAVNEAHAAHTHAISLCKHVPLRGDARVLAVRTTGQLRHEVAELMQWNKRWLRVKIYGEDMVIRKMDSSDDVSVRVWWTEEDALKVARREAWATAMEDAAMQAMYVGGRVSRKDVGIAADAMVARYVEMGNVGELLGWPGPLRVTQSGFVFVRQP